MTLEFEVFLSTTLITNFSIPSTHLKNVSMLSCLLHAGPAGPSGGYEKGDNLIFTIYDEDSDLRVDLRIKESLLNDPKKMVFQKFQN